MGKYSIFRDVSRPLKSGIIKRAVGATNIQNFSVRNPRSPLSLARIFNIAPSIPVKKGSDY